MWFRHRAWIPVCWLLSAANVGFTWYARGEWWHALIHAVLVVVFAIFALRLTARPRAT